ncbi:MAG TPA: signal peptidase I [Desulfuromonadaceae bacterium]|nr:signal peptidase I [Desulfuromonadaceae bacterium]
MIRWFTSKAVRDAGTMRKHVQRLLNAQRDLMKPEALAAIEAKINELNSAVAEGHAGRIRIKTEELQFAAEKWIKPYPNPVWRENVEVLLVAIAVAMGIRTFFLQPFKIPTGSMQPTLYGVTSIPDFSKVRSEEGAVEQARLREELVIPGGWERFKQWFHGVSYIDLKAQADGTLDRIDPPVTLKLLNLYQTIWIGGQAHTLWFPPDLGEPYKTRAGEIVDPLKYRAGLVLGHPYHKGDQVVKLEGHAGDHLFVDRLSYNFRKPDRGEIVVFETAGIPSERRDLWGIPSDQFYIKRLVGLGGETIQVGDDRHLVIDNKRLDAATPHFENVYSFDPKQSARESHWSGHLNGADKPFFPDGTTSYTIPKGHVMVMGDNTMNSLDSRYWGDFPESYIMGRAFFVYWPITERFGFGNK